MKLPTHSGMMDAPEFKQEFPDIPAIVMPARDLQSELTSVRDAFWRALPDQRPYTTREPPLPDAEVRCLLARKLEAHLPPPSVSVPASTLHPLPEHFFAQLSPSEGQQIYSALSRTCHTLAAARKSAPLFLVPAAFRYRVMQAVSGHLYLAQIRHWSW